jgi:hypothetical protein
MSRKGYARSRRSGLEPNQESRGGRLLKAYRQVASDSAGLVGGCILDLCNSNDLPNIEMISQPRAFVFDPRLMPRNVNLALTAGYKIGTLQSQIKNADNCPDEGYDVDLGSSALLRGNRTIVVPVESNQFTTERNEVYGILSKSGIKGFTSKGTRKGYRIETPRIAIGNFSQPLSHKDKIRVLGIIDDALSFQLAPNLEAKPSVALGELVIQEYRPN